MNIDKLILSKTARVLKSEKKNKKEHTKRPEGYSEEYNGIAYLAGNSKKRL